METKIVNGQISIGGAAENVQFDVEKINTSLKNHVLEYGEILEKVVKSRDKKMSLSCGDERFELYFYKFNGEYTLIVDDVEWDRSVYHDYFQFKTMSGYNVNEAIRGMLNAIVACYEYAQVFEKLNDWWNENPEKAETIESISYADHTLFVWVNGIYIESYDYGSITADNVIEYIDSQIPYEIGTYLECQAPGNGGECDFMDAVRLARFAEIWGLDFKVDDFVVVPVPVAVNA